MLRALYDAAQAAIRCVQIVAVVIGSVHLGLYIGERLAP